MTNYLYKLFNTSYKTLTSGSSLEKIAFFLKISFVIGPLFLVRVLCSNIGYTVNYISVVLIFSTILIFLIIVLYCLLWEYLDTKKEKNSKGNT